MTLQERNLISPVAHLAEAGPERGETDKQKIVWLAGMFEAGGAMYFSVGNQQVGTRVLTYTYPVLCYSDTNEDKMRLLVAEFGGFYRRNKTSENFSWYLKAIQKTVPLIYSLDGKSPSRRNFIEATKNWAEANSREERELAMLNFRDLENQNLTEKSDYEHLIPDPAFVAGVVCSRGGIYYGEGKDRVQQLRVESTNLGLMEGLKERFGGVIRVQVEKGSVVKIRGREVTAKKDSYELALGQKDSTDLLSSVKLYLVYGRVNKTA